MVKRKKAITPLISTIMLLLFAVGLGTLVMSWGNSEKFKLASCEHSSISITKIDNVAQLCIKDGIIKGTLENNGNNDINSIKVVMLTSDSLIEENLNLGIKSGSYSNFEFKSKQLDPAKFLKIRIIPLLGEQLCVDNRIELERIGECR